MANGDKLQAQYLCAGLGWEVHGVQLCADFFVMPLRGCNIVLGFQWLVTLGLILWDFIDLTMKFMWNNRDIIW